MRFRNFVMQNFPFIEDDFDALTDYELFCKMIQYTINAVKGNKELEKQVNDLKEEIENLDLQDEVDNKLDEMASDGTLAEIINQEIFEDLNTAIGSNSDEIAELQKFNNYTNKPLMYGKLNYPSDFNHYNFDLIRKDDNKIDDNLDLSSYDTVNVLYVDRDNGNDSNDGASATPKKTIKGALTAISSATGNNWKVICKSYQFFRNEFVGETTQTDNYDMYKNIIIEPYDKDKKILVTTAQETLSWTSDGNGVYHATRSSIDYVCDMTEKDVYGVYKKVPEVSTLTECQNTVNSYYISGNDIYIHTKSGSAPTTSTYLISLALSTAKFNIRANLYLRLKNIDFYVSGAMDFHNASTNYENTLICENVGIYYCGDNNGFSINNVKNVYMINCKTGYNLRDGFSYHFSQTPSATVSNSIIYEKNCMSFENGINDTNSNNNCSTIHEGANIVRVNGVYKNSKGPSIADVGSSKTLMIHCGINQDISYNSFNFQDSGSAGVGKAYLVDCSALQTNTNTLTGTSGFVIKLKNFHGNYVNADLDIDLYTE